MAVPPAKLPIQRISDRLETQGQGSNLREILAAMEKRLNAAEGGIQTIITGGTLTVHTHSDYTQGGPVLAPTAPNATTTLVTITGAAAQTADLEVWRSSTPTVLSGITAAGNYYLTSGGALGSLFVSSAAGVGSWATAASVIDVTRTWQTLQIFKDTTIKIVDDGDATKTLVFSLGGATAGADLTLVWSGTADRTVTIPDGTTTLAGLAITPQSFTGLNTFTRKVVMTAGTTVNESGLRISFAASVDTSANPFEIFESDSAQLYASMDFSGNFAALGIGVFNSTATNKTVFLYATAVDNFVTIPNVTGQLVLTTSGAPNLVSGRVPICNGTHTITTDTDLTFLTDTLTATKTITSLQVTSSGIVDSLSSGFKLIDLTVATKRLFFVLSNSVGDSAIIVRNTAGRQYSLPNYDGYIPVPINEGTLNDVLTSAGTGSQQVWTSTLNANARVTVRKNTGANVGARRRINFIEGTNVTLTVTDDSVDEEVDVQINSAGGSGATMGTATLDFGATPATEASIAVTGQAAILATSHVDAYFMSETTDEEAAATFVTLRSNTPSAGTGFTIFAQALAFVTGNVTLHWRWQ